VTGFARDGEGALGADGVGLAALAERYGTPLYVYSAAAVGDAYDRYHRAFAAVPHRICYALKANPCGALLRLLAGRGAGADIVSGFELLAALRAGFPVDRVVFSGVGKTDAEIALAVERGVGEFNAESEEEIARIGRAASAAGAEARVTLRVNPDIDARSHPYISTGLKESKFGVDIAAAPAILDRARRVPGVRVVGVQSHIGSQITSLEPLGSAAGELAALSRRLLDAGHALETIDVGGGLGLDYRAGTGPDVEGFARAVLPAVSGLGLTVIMEPGRSLVAAAGVLVTRVLYVKENRGKRFVIADAAMNDLMRPSLYDAYHRVETVGRPPEQSRVADLVGPVCETGDFLARNRELPEVEPGDLLAVRDAGAYGFSMASQYNMRPRAAEVLVDEGGPRLVRRRESFDDLVRAEVP
jgi:diaminopimelate decarboxylase